MNSKPAPDFDRFAHEHGFQLRLGRWDFVYSEGRKRLTLPPARAPYSRTPGAHLATGPGWLSFFR